MGFLSFFTFCVRLRCVLFFSCTIKVPFLIKIVYQNGTSRLIIYKNPPLVKPFFKFFRHLCTEKVKSPTLQVHYVTPQSKQQPPYMYTSLPFEVNNLPRFRTQNMPRNASTTGFFSPPNINKGILIFPFLVHEIARCVPFGVKICMYIYIKDNNSLLKFLCLY